MTLSPLFRRFGVALGLVAAAIAAPAEGEACSRVVYKGTDGLLIVGRSLDWKTPIPTNLYVYPRGMHKVGCDKPNAVKWTSQYGAVYAVSYDGGITEGMNEKGLVVNSLFCKGTVYNNPETEVYAPMSLAVFVAWILDMNATTPEAVAMLRTEKFSIGGATFDNGTVSLLHWAITDREGRCAILEYDNGNLNIYEGTAEDMPVLTNDPPYPQMKAINAYWEGVGGTNMLPGGVRSADRFVRATFFDGHVETTGDANLGAAITRSIVMNVSVPYTYTVSTEANVSSTQWRSMANLRDLYYYWDVATNLGVFYIDLGRMDLYPGAPVKKLVCADYPSLAGCANHEMKTSKPFTPMY